MNVFVLAKIHYNFSCLVYELAKTLVSSAVLILYIVLE